MSKVFQATALLAALFSAVSAHTSVEQFKCGGETYPGYRQASKQDPQNKSPAWWTAQGWGYQPVMGDKLNHPDIIAHVDASPSPYTVECPAGEPVTFSWHHEGACEEGEEGWDCSHHGWTATYLAPCHGDCADVDKTTLKFFKIHQSALLDYRPGRYSSGAPQEQTGYWGTDAIFYSNGNTQDVLIPSEIPSGNYVLRTEVMSVHNNGDVSQRQFWPQAFNIKVTGGDDAQSVPAGKLGTELYSADDELLQWDLYWHTAGEVIKAAPGPAIANIISAIGLKARSVVATIAAATRNHARDFSA